MILSRSVISRLFPLPPLFAGRYSKAQFANYALDTLPPPLKTTIANMADQTGEIDLDSVIDRLLEGEQIIPSPFLGSTRQSPTFTLPVTALIVLVRGNRPGKAVQLQEYEIKYLCTKAREIFIGQPILLELEAPIKICGKLTICPLGSERANVPP